MRGADTLFQSSLALFWSSAILNEGYEHAFSMSAGAFSTFTAFKEHL
jgi:hypothetical protein